MYHLKHDYALLQAHNLNSFIMPKRTSSSNEKPATAAFRGAADVTGMHGGGVTAMAGAGVTRMRCVEGVGVKEWLWRSLKERRERSPLTAPSNTYQTQERGDSRDMHLAYHPGRIPTDNATVPVPHKSQECNELE
jgi:hypothetical protein